MYLMMSKAVFLEGQKKVIPFKKKLDRVKKVGKKWTHGG